MFKRLLLIFTISALTSGCLSMPIKEEGKHVDGVSTTTQALAAGAVVTGVGLVAIPFLGPILAGAALLSYSNDANESAAAVNKKCITFFEDANKRKWSAAKIEAERRRVGC